MALEKRGRELFYYKKRRVGKSVVSEYCGAGSLGQLMYLWDQESQGETRREQEVKKQSFEAEKKKVAEVDHVIESFCQVAVVRYRYRAKSIQKYR